MLNRHCRYFCKEKHSTLTRHNLLLSIVVSSEIMSSHCAHCKDRCSLLQNHDRQKHTEFAQKTEEIHPQLLSEQTPAITPG